MFFRIQLGRYQRVRKLDVAICLRSSGVRDSLLLDRPLQVVGQHQPGRHWQHPGPLHRVVRSGSRPPSSTTSRGRDQSVFAGADITKHQRLVQCGDDSAGGRQRRWRLEPWLLAPVAASAAARLPPFRKLQPSTKYHNDLILCLHVAVNWWWWLVKKKFEKKRKKKF